MCTVLQSSGSELWLWEQCWGLWTSVQLYESWLALFCPDEPCCAHVSFFPSASLPASHPWQVSELTMTAWPLCSAVWWGMQVGWAHHLGIKVLLSLLVSHQTTAAICVGPVGCGKEKGIESCAVERDPVPWRRQDVICAVVCTKGWNSLETGSGDGINYCGDQGTCFPQSPQWPEVSGRCLKTTATTKSL